MFPLSALPSVNAGLNALSGVLLLAGYLFIRRGNIRAHRACMLSAFTVSSLFLISYVIYHYNAGSTEFTGQGWTRPLYFTILISHIALAIAVVPLALITLSRALRRRFGTHRHIARRTLPIWLYVSATGVIVYLMLYHFFGAAPIAAR